ncbi:unnamed protein product [Medioppia subpectinata]|uniref:DNA mismatch repair proteins mutS family domain-containing protein n=1 Tax=Medioppia subpectinata TaxID=1979941 RepID=A0A7R9KPJ7_9ACAR|nr:unnamed protein product [Medioppia subpectinata]CAG2107456.1 unnamed protein product [Medioppia subpectinata]
MGLYPRGYHWEANDQLLIRLNRTNGIPPGEYTLGWKFKYLTFWNLLINAFVFALCLTSDCLKSNYLPQNPLEDNWSKSLFQMRDTLFHALAFPLGTFVFLMFFLLLTIRKGLVADEITHKRNPWFLGHLTHTIVLPLLLSEALITYHKKWSTLVMDITILLSVVLWYTLWMLYLGAVHDLWPYRVLRVMGWPLRLALTLISILIISWPKTRRFNDLFANKGLELIRNLCCDDYKTVEMELKNQYYCLSSAAALLKYTKGALNMRLEKCHAIKKGLNHLLDIARQTYSENVDDISYIVDQYSSEYSLPLRVIYTSGRGFHMQIVGKDVHKMEFSYPRHFLRINASKTAIAFTTREIVEKNNRIKSAVEEIYLMSDAIISELIARLRANIGCLYNVSEVLSKIDLVFALAFQCSVANYVRPVFSGDLAVKQGRHPILEKILSTKPVANDILMCEDNNFMVITGPNMSGKSTFLKQVAIHQVMAQIGSYIPAEFASFRICDKLFSRIGNNDEIETNSSTFMVEMRDVSHILHNCTQNSLIIIDELGRGTSVEEGVGFCFAICEQLLQTKALTLFATHFTEMTKLEDFYYNVSNYGWNRTVVIPPPPPEPESDSYTDDDDID